MKIISIDFEEVDNKKKLNEYLDDQLKLSGLVKGKYGYNLDAFYDAYAYSDHADFFRIVNYNNITNNEFKEYAGMFIRCLDELKKTNKNMRYEIVS